MTHQRLELASQLASLDPVDHEAAVAGAGGDALRGVHVVKVIADVFPGFDEVTVRGAACFRRCALVCVHLWAGWSCGGCMHYACMFGSGMGGI